MGARYRRSLRRIGRLTVNPFWVYAGGGAIPPFCFGVYQMRKESQKIARAFLDGKPASAARTVTDGQAVFLHGHKIAWRDDDGALVVSLAGWGTVTTRDRLNTIFRLANLGAGVYQRKGEQFLQVGEIVCPMDEKGVYRVAPARALEH